MPPKLLAKLDKKKKLVYPDGKKAIFLKSSVVLLL